MRVSSLERAILFALTVATCLWFSELTRGQEQSSFARGPLRVHPTNPRYFTDGTRSTDGSLRAVYLTGAHAWNSLVDIGPGDPPPPFDYGGYLDFLVRHQHSSVRLWMEEEVTWEIRQQTNPPVQNFMGPLPWARTGLGSALDGKPKFDLNQCNPVFFERLSQSKARSSPDRQSPVESSKHS